MPARTRLSPPPCPPSSATTMIGSAKPRNWSITPTNTAARCSRRPSDVIVRARQFADPAPDRLGLCPFQRRDLGLAGGGMEGHAGEVEERLQQAALGVDVLDPADRHQRPALGPDPRPQVDLVFADLIAPATPAQARDDDYGGDAEGGDQEPRRPAWNGDVVSGFAERERKDGQNQRPEGEHKSPEPDRSLRQALLGF